MTRSPPPPTKKKGGKKLFSFNLVLLPASLSAFLCPSATCYSLPAPSTPPLPDMLAHPSPFSPPLPLSGWYVPRTKSRDGGIEKETVEREQAVLGGMGGQGGGLSFHMRSPRTAVLLHRGILKISITCKLLAKGHQCITPQSASINVSITKLCRCCKNK